MTKPKLCKDCKWYTVVRGLPNLKTEFCEALNLISGVHDRKNVIKYRAYFCGPEGKYWEENP